MHARFWAIQLASEYFSANQIAWWRAIKDYLNRVGSRFVCYKFSSILIKNFTLLFWMFLELFLLTIRLWGENVFASSAMRVSSRRFFPEWKIPTIVIRDILSFFLFWAKALALNFHARKAPLSCTVLPLQKQKNKKVLSVNCTSLFDRNWPAPRRDFVWLG